MPHNFLLSAFAKWKTKKLSQIFLEIAIDLVAGAQALEFYRRREIFIASLITSDKNRDLIVRKRKTFQSTRKSGSFTRQLCVTFTSMRDSSGRGFTLYAMQFFGNSRPTKKDAASKTSSSSSVKTRNVEEEKSKIKSKFMVIFAFVCTTHNHRTFSSLQVSNEIHNSSFASSPFIIMCLEAVAAMMVQRINLAGQSLASSCDESSRKQFKNLTKPFCEQLSTSAGLKLNR